MCFSTVILYTVVIIMSRINVMMDRKGSLEMMQQKSIVQGKPERRNTVWGPSEKRIFYSELATLVFPIAMQNFMSAVVSASDALMLGMLDQNSLSAISLATQVQFVLNLFFSGLTLGATILAAQYWGKGDKNAVEHVLAVSLRFSMLISLIFFILANACPAFLMRIFTNEEALVTAGIPYLRIVSWSYLFMGVTQIYLCIMKSSKRTLRSTVYGSTALILNLILNSILIFGLAGAPRMEICGAALATSLARAVELLLVLLENRKADVVRIRMDSVKKPDRKLQKDFIHYTTPVLANLLAWGCGFAMFSVIMGHLGSDAVAANSIAGIVKNIIACVCCGMGTGSSIMVGNELGKGNLERARRYGDKLCHVAIVCGLISGAVVLAGSPLILCFTGTLTAQAREYLKIMLVFCTYYMVGKAINCTTIAGIFCAGGDTRFGFLCDTINMWAVIVPVGLIAAFVLHLPVLVVYFLLNLDEIIKLPVVYLHYKRYGWVNNLTNS